MQRSRVRGRALHARVSSGGDPDRVGIVCAWLAPVSDPVPARHRAGLASGSCRLAGLVACWQSPAASHAAPAHTPGLVDPGADPCSSGAVQSQSPGLEAEWGLAYAQASCIPSLDGSRTALASTRATQARLDATPCMADSPAAGCSFVDCAGAYLSDRPTHGTRPPNLPAHVWSGVWEGELICTA